MIHVNNNKCPICLTDDLPWNLNHTLSKMEMFKCGHGTCKYCYHKMVSSTECSLSFSCPLCRGNEQPYKLGVLSDDVSKWTTFAEWYSDFEIYIKAGVANNVVQTSTFGQQLLRLMRESRRSRSRSSSSSR